MQTLGKLELTRKSGFVPQQRLQSDMTEEHRLRTARHSRQYMWRRGDGVLLRVAPF